MATLDSTSLRRYLEQFTETLTPELAEHLANQPPDPKFQTLLDNLGAKANEGTLTEEERREYETYVDVMDVFALLHLSVVAGR